jgi:gp16 family phage-associated protein
VKTLEQVKAEFERRGETVAHWARKHGFAINHVRAVLSGKAKGRWGESHKIAVTLEIKDGEIANE